MSPTVLLRLVLSLRALPLLVAGVLSPKAGPLVRRDVERWQQCLRRPERGTVALLLLLSASTHEFRNLYYHRLRWSGVIGGLLSRAMAWLYRPEPSLFLWTRDIGPGLFIQHGFATIVSAQRVGADCWINQQVTIGFDENLGAPVLEDGVTVSAGAIVIGKVNLGAGSVIGAGAVVTKDVPPGSVAVGVPASTRPRRRATEEPLEGHCE